MFGFGDFLNSSGMASECYICSASCVLKEKLESRDAVFGYPCDCCKKTVCRNCTKLSPTEMRTVVLSTRCMLYYCPNCMVTIQEVPRLKSQMEELRSEIEQLKEMVGAKQSYADVVKSVEQETHSIKGELENMKARMNEKVAAAEEAMNFRTPLNVEPAILEMQERERRACNLLIFGLSECKEDKREQRMAKERQTVVGLISQLSEDSPVDQIKQYRIGKYDVDRVRPVKVVFPSKEEAIKVLRVKNKLSSQGVYIKYDQTPSQRAFLKDLMAELHRREQSGERDIAISYYNGIPKIVKHRAGKHAPKNFTPRQ